MRQGADPTVTPTKKGETDDATPGAYHSPVGIGRSRGPGPQPRLDAAACGGRRGATVPGECCDQRGSKRAGRALADLLEHLLLRATERHDEHDRRGCKEGLDLRCVLRPGHGLGDPELYDQLHAETGTEYGRPRAR